jgi:hypothetical protein
LFADPGQLDFALIEPPYVVPLPEPVQIKPKKIKHKAEDQ